MYTKTDVFELAVVIQKARTVTNRLIKFLQPVARALDFDDVIEIDTEDGGDTVTFVAEWNGPYQAYNKETFTFPISLLEQGDKAIVNYLKEKQRLEGEALQQEKKAADERHERAVYESLRLKYANQPVPNP